MGRLELSPAASPEEVGGVGLFHEDPPQWPCGAKKKKKHDRKNVALP